MHCRAHPSNVRRGTAYTARMYLFCVDNADAEPRPTISVSAVFIWWICPGATLSIVEQWIGDIAGRFQGYDISTLILWLWTTFFLVILGFWGFDYVHMFQQSGWTWSDIWRYWIILDTIPVWDFKQLHAINVANFMTIISLYLPKTTYFWNKNFQ